MSSDVLIDIDLTCPLCGTEFKATKTKVKTKETTPVGYEDYLVPIYKNEYTNPMSYEIIVCPECYYSVFHSDFSQKKKKNKEILVTAKKIKDDLIKIGRDVNFNTLQRNYGLARLSYIIAAHIYEKHEPKQLIKLSKCYIRIAWYSKQLKDYDFYRTALKKAQDAYIRSYNAIDDFETSATLLFIIATLYEELGDFEAAAPYLNKLNGNQKMKKVPAIVTKLEDVTNKARRVLKKIDEEERELTKEEKKAEKKKRKEAIKTKPFKKPFGIELELPKTDDLEKRKKKEKTQAEKDYNIKLTGKPTVLVVDDSKLIRSNIRNVLISHADIVGEATNGNEAVLLYQELKPDFITLDLEMPGMNGIEAIHKIIEYDKEAKIIMLTSNKESKNVVAALKAGALNYLIKPVNREKLVAIIDKYEKEKKESETNSS